MLLDLARTSEWSHMRESALVALPKIGVEPKALISVVRHNLHNPIGTYTRVKALEVIGEVKERAALELIPDILMVLEKEPTDYEITTLINSLRKGGFPREKQIWFLEKILKLDKGHTKETASRYLEQLRFVDKDGLTRDEILRKKREEEYKRYLEKKNSKKRG